MGEIEIKALFPFSFSKQQIPNKGIAKKLVFSSLFPSIGSDKIYLLMTANKKKKKAQRRAQVALAGWGSPLVLRGDKSLRNSVPTRFWPRVLALFPCFFLLLFFYYNYFFFTTILNNCTAFSQKQSLADSGERSPRGECEGSPWTCAAIYHTHPSRSTVLCLSHK